MDICLILSFFVATDVNALLKNSIKLKAIKVFMDVKMRGRPLVNDHPEGSSSIKEEGLGIPVV